jgi:hypothetical protein
VQAGDLIKSLESVSTRDMEVPGYDQARNESVLIRRPNDYRVE